MVYVAVVVLAGLVVEVVVVLVLVLLPASASVVVLVVPRVLVASVVAAGGSVRAMRPSRGAEQWTVSMVQWDARPATPHPVPARHCAQAAPQLAWSTAKFRFPHRRRLSDSMESCASLVQLVRTMSRPTSREESSIGKVR